MQHNRIKHHLIPALVGIGCVLGAPGLPRTMRVVGEVALEQGRAEEREGNIRSLEIQNEEGPISSPSAQQTTETAEDDAEEEIEDEDEVAVDESQNQGEENPTSHAGDTEKRRLILKALSGSQRMREAAQTTPALSLVTDKIRRSMAADDPFGQLDASSTSVLPYQSSPAISTSKRSRQSESGNVVEGLIQEYDLDIQSRLLQSHYCRSEVLTLRSLVSQTLIVS